MFALFDETLNQAAWFDHAPSLAAWFDPSFEPDVIAAVGAGSAIGFAAAVGRATAGAAGSGAGAATAIGAGQAIAASAGSASATGSASGAGVAVRLGVGSATGAGAASATGAATAFSVGASEAGFATPTTLNAADKHASATLSNGNLTITGVAFNSAMSARSIGTRRAAGSLSLTIGTLQSGSQVFFGLCNLTTDMTSFGARPGFGDSNGIIVEIAQSGGVNLFRNAAANNVAATGSHTAGDSYRLGFDDFAGTVTLYRSRGAVESSVATASCSTCTSSAR